MCSDPQYDMAAAAVSLSGILSGRSASRSGSGVRPACGRLIGPRCGRRPPGDLQSHYWSGLVHGAAPSHWSGHSAWTAGSGARHASLNELVKLLAARRRHRFAIQMSAPPPVIGTRVALPSHDRVWAVID